MTKTIFPALMGAFLLTIASTQAEARMGLPAFEALDADGTGEVTQEQFAALLQAPRERMIAQIMEQADDDGLLDEDALRAGLTTIWPEMRGHGRADMSARLFSRIDSNGDGVIDAEEYARFAERMQERGQRGKSWRGRD